MGEDLKINLLLQWTKMQSWETERVLSYRQNLIHDIDGCMMAPIQCWPENIRKIFALTPIGDVQSFQIVLFFIGNGFSPYVIGEYIIMSYMVSSDAEKNRTTRKRIEQIEWVHNNIDNHKTWRYFDITERKMLLFDGTIYKHNAV